MVSVFGKFNFVDKLSKFAAGQKKGEEIKQVSSFLVIKNQTVT